MAVKTDLGFYPTTPKKHIRRGKRLFEIVLEEIGMELADWVLSRAKQ
jgi:hypothetical protein